jgi:hypothetical protein
MLASESAAMRPRRTCAVLAPSSNEDVASVLYLMSGSRRTGVDGDGEVRCGWTGNRCGAVHVWMQRRKFQRVEIKFCLCGLSVSVV